MDATQTSPCPQRETLTQFNLGNLGDGELEGVAAHVEECGDCQAALNEIAGKGDGFVDALRRDVANETGKDTRRVRCPFCRHEVTLPLEADSAEVVCGGCGSGFSLTDASTLPWTGSSTRTIGRFEIVRELGSGAFGTVYLARDEKLDRQVALKVPRRGALPTPEELARFLSEARSVAKLNHAGIVPVHDVGEHEETPYLVSEYVEGLTLADRLTAGPLAFREAAELTAAAADALQAAHHQGIVHRDVKPSNIMIDADGNPRLMDFGLAKRDAADVTMTLDGDVLGTPAYMSPEQAAGKSHEVDARGDVYSLGAVLYQLLTGELPFRGNVRMLIHQVIHDEPRPPRSLNDRIPRDPETICTKAMAKQPGRRYPSAAAMAQDLRRWLAGEPIEARPVTRVERLWRWCRRKPAIAALTGGVAAMLLAVIGILSVLYLREVKLQDALVKQASAEASQRAEKKRREDLAKLEYRNRYAADMRTGFQLWNGGEMSRLRKVLDAHDPRDGRREFAWGYLDRLLRQAAGRRFRADASELKSIDISPDGTILATAGAEGVGLWEPGSGKLRRRLHAMRGSKKTPLAVHNIVFHPDGKRLAGACADGACRLWDLETGEVRQVYQGGESPVRAITFAKRGKLLFAGGKTLSARKPQPVRCWDVESGRLLESFVMPLGDRLYALDASPDGGTLILGAVALWFRDIEAKKFADPLYPGRVCWCLACSPDGETIAVAHQDNIELWDMKTRKLRTTLQGHRRYIHSLRFSRDGRRLVSGGHDKSLHVWDVRRGILLDAWQGQAGRIVSACISPDGRRIWAAQLDGMVSAHDLEAGQESQPLARSFYPIHGLSFLGTSRRLAVATGEAGAINATGELEVWDADSHTGARLQRAGAIAAVAYSPDGRRVAVAKRAETVDRPSEIEILTLPEGVTERTLYGLNWGVGKLAFSPDGSLLAASSHRRFPWGRGELLVWNVSSGKPAREIIRDGVPVSAFCFSADGKQLFVVHEDHRLPRLTLSPAVRPRCCRQIPNTASRPWSHGVGNCIRSAAMRTIGTNPRRSPCGTPRAAKPSILGRPMMLISPRWRCRRTRKRLPAPVWTATSSYGTRPAANGKKR